MVKFTKWLLYSFWCRYNKRMDRITRFKQLKDHPWLARSYLKLTKADLNIIYAFLKTTEHDNCDVFAHKAVRLFLDQQKPKNWTYIEELLIAVK